MDVVEECFFGADAPRARCTDQGNHFELISMVQMESQHPIGWPVGCEFPRFVIISEISRPEVGSH